MIDRVVTTYRGFAISQDDRGFYWMYGQYRPTLEEAKAQIDRYLIHDKEA